MSKHGKLSNTAALQVPKTGDDYAHHSVSVRKIDNGFVKSVSRSGPEGHEHRETFHRTHPGMAPGKSPGGGNSTGALRDAIAHCKDGDCS